MLRFPLSRTGQSLLVIPRSVTDDGGNWSPFARNEGADCDAVAQALLRAVGHEACSLDELSPTRYAELRRRRPQMGLPRTTTITAVCGNWGSAIEAAERCAAASFRRSALTG